MSNAPIIVGRPQFAVASNQVSGQVLNPNNSAVKIQLADAGYGPLYSNLWDFANNRFILRRGIWQLNACLSVINTNVLANDYYISLVEENLLGSIARARHRGVVGVGFTINLFAILEITSLTYAVSMNLFGLGNNSASTLSLSNAAPGGGTFFKVEKLG